MRCERALMWGRKVHSRTASSSCSRLIVSIRSCGAHSKGTVQVWEAVSMHTSRLGVKQHKPVRAALLEPRQSAAHTALSRAW